MFSRTFCGAIGHVCGQNAPLGGSRHIDRVVADPMPDDHWAGATGFIHEVAYRTYLAQHSYPENCHYYLCGPPLMVRAVLAMLDNLGVDPDAIFFDDFGG